MIQSFINLRFEEFEKRLNEIELLIQLAITNESNSLIYQALCRSAHVLLVSHFEGLYKDICKDILSDINANTIFSQVPKDILYTHCSYFINSHESEKSTHEIKIKLIDAFYLHPSKLKFEPFLNIDNRNPTPQIIESILERFGVSNFFWNIENSDLDVVFKDLKTETIEIKNRLLFHLKEKTYSYPYLVDKSIYNPVLRENHRKTKTLWEDFINSFLKERHNIIHGHTLNNPYNHEELGKAKLKIEILICVYILNICSVANPINN